jgi:hypothetical protein
MRAGIHHVRLKAFGEIGSDEEVAESARAILEDREASETFVLDAILALANVDPPSLQRIRGYPALKNAEPLLLADISVKLFASTSALQASAEVLAMTLEKLPDWRPENELWQYQLILIAGGKFKRAIELTEKCNPDWEQDLATAFNYAMAAWGENRKPPLPLIKHLLPMFDEYVQAQLANLEQCLGLCHALLGNTNEMDDALRKSRTAIRIMNRREFSCWTYSNVSPGDFEAHLDLIRQFANGRGEPPEFLAKAWHGEPAPA